LVVKGIINNANVKFKILNSGKLEKKVIIKKCPISESARSKVKS